MGFSVWDWCILFIYFAGTMYVGIISRKYVSKVEDFLVAGRGLNVYIGVATLLATETATITIMNFSQMGFLSGFAGLALALIGGGVMVWIGKTGFLIEKLRELELMTIPEYFQRRFDKGTRVICGLLLGVGAALNMGIFLKYDAIFLSIMIGIPQQELAITMAVLLIFVLIYVLLGGMISIVLTDFIQFIFLSIGALFVTVLLLFKFNIIHIIDATTSSIPQGGLNPFTSPQMGWVFLIWQIILQIAIWTTWQTTVMRIFSAKSSAVGKKIFIWTGIMMIGMLGLPVIWGIFARAILGGGVDSTQGMPILLSKILPIGLKGLIVAAMLAASMSTYSGYLLGWGAIFSQDVIIPLRGKELSSKTQIVINRFFVLLLGLFILFYGLLYKLSDTIFVYTSMTANLYLAGTFISIIGGIYWKKANTTGAYFSLIAGAVPIISFFFFSISAEIAGALSFVFAILGMFLGSLIGSKLELVRFREVES